MRRRSSIAVVMVLVSCGMAHGGPVLLATGGGTEDRTLSGLIDTVTLNGILRLQHTENGPIETFDLFDELDTVVSLDAPPITVSDSVGSILDDADFGAFQSLLTNGTDFEILFLYDSVVGVISARSGPAEGQFLQLVVPPFSDVDLFGYEIQRIDRIVTYEMTTAADGLNTEVSIEESVMFYGVPEPSTLAMGIVGCLTLFGMRGIRSFR